MITVIAVDEKNLTLFAPAIHPDDQKALRDPEGTSFALGAVEGAAAVGVIVFEVVSAILLIKEFYVAENARLRGVGTALLDELMAVAEEANLPITCHLNVAPDALETDPFAAFFHKHGFAFYPDRIDRFACVLGEIDRQLLSGGEPAPGVRLCSFNELDAAAVEQFRRRTNDGRSDYLPDAFTKQMILPGLSIAAVENRTVVAALLVEAIGRELSVTYTYVRDGRLPELTACFERCFALANDSLPPELVIRFNTINAATKKLLYTFIPNVRPVTVGYATWTERSSSPLTSARRARAAYLSTSRETFFSRRSGSTSSPTIR